MVEQHYATADAAACRVVVARHKWPHAGIGAQDACARQRGNKLHALFEKNIHLFGCDTHVVNLGDGNSVAGSAQHAHNLVGDQDVAVGRLAATVYHHVVDSVPEDEQRPLGREHVDGHSCLLSHEGAPYSCGIHGHWCISLARLAREVVAQPHTHHAGVLHNEVDNLMIGERHSAMTARVDKVGGSQGEGIDRCIGHTHGTNEHGIHRRFYDSCLGRVDNLGIDAGTQAGIDKGGLIVEVILGESDKKAVGLLDAMASDVSQNHVLANTLGSALLVGDGIACTTVHQAMIAACGTIGEVVTLHKQHLQATQRTVARSAGTSNATAYYYNVIFLCKRIVIFLHFERVVRLIISGHKPNYKDTTKIIYFLVFNTFYQHFSKNSQNTNHALNKTLLFLII